MFDFAISFFNLLPILSYKVDFLLKTMSIPNDHRLYPVLCYMREHAFRNLKIEQVAAEFNISVRNLSRLLHESGIRFNSFINRHRVNRAIELFSDGGKTMQQIAYETGFSTPNNFNRVFRQITGTSPSLYEKGVADNKKSAIEQ
ncbi:MAG: AraC family transcriptional regulator [Candidatus Phocaeicola faecigallinarum]|uniref:AraC family transcriptional regulator n=1 Tax=Candidatus Phocaeicola faecigallinarum TaxID=2838732 RepID=A0A948TEB0_9BACT|nr:AraC family transcriptional regulator [Candidatus Phocaeicola faecigallinarum]